MSDASHWSEVFKDIGTSAAAFAAVAGAVIALLQYFSFKFTTHRDKAAATRKSLETVVASLASTNEVDRLAGAILLRKFFDPTSEVSTKGTPYATDAVTVIAAILRGQPAGHFQQLLADGLAFAPSLQGADLQEDKPAERVSGLAWRAPVSTLRRADFFSRRPCRSIFERRRRIRRLFLSGEDDGRRAAKKPISRKPISAKPTFSARVSTAPRLTGEQASTEPGMCPAALAPHIKDNLLRDGPEGLQAAERRTAEAAAAADGRVREQTRLSRRPSGKDPCADLRLAGVRRV